MEWQVKDEKKIKKTPLSKKVFNLILEYKKNLQPFYGWYFQPSLDLSSEGKTRYILRSGLRGFTTQSRFNSVY